MSEEERELMVAEGIEEAWELVELKLSVGALESLDVLLEAAAAAERCAGRDIRSKC